MDAAYLTHRNGLQTERILITQVILRGERQLRYIVDRGNIFRLNAHLVHLTFIKGDLLITGLHGLDQSLCLEFAHLFARHTLHSGIVNHGSKYLFYS